jgi:hypothetical protein
VLSGGLWWSASAVGTRTGAERRHSGRGAGDVEVCAATGIWRGRACGALLGLAFLVGQRARGADAAPGMERIEGRAPFREGRAERWLRDEETARSRRNHAASGRHIR